MKIACRLLIDLPSVACIGDCIPRRSAQDEVFNADLMNDHKTFKYPLNDGEGIIWQAIPQLANIEKGIGCWKWDNHLPVPLIILSP